jgi:hypothetical protein
MEKKTENKRKMKKEGNHHLGHSSRLSPTSLTPMRPMSTLLAQFISRTHTLSQTRGLGRITPLTARWPPLGSLHRYARG